MSIYIQVLKINAAEVGFFQRERRKGKTVLLILVNSSGRTRLKGLHPMI